MDATTPLDNHYCPDCEIAVDAADNYCRRCGMYLAIAATERALPARLSGQRAVATRTAAGLPAPVKKAAAAVAVGAALQVGAGLAGRYLLKQAMQSLRPSLPSSNPGRSKGNAPAKRDEAPVAQPASVVSETLMIRRVWMRRDS